MVRCIKIVLVDLSGTLHIDNAVLPGAVEALNRLRSCFPVKFVTNTTKESTNIIFKRLTSLGFDVRQNELFSSLAAARKLISSKEFNPMLLVDPAAMEDFTDCVHEDKPFNAVIVGLAPDKFCYEILNEAFKLLLNGAHLVAIHKGKYYRRSDGLALGPGMFIKGLEHAADVKAQLVGKPSPNFFMAALGDIPPAEALMIGDDVQDDIAGAQAVGISGILVKTGKYRTGDENKIAVPPTKVCTSFVEAVGYITENFV